jgi:hypothetical protein
MKIEISQKFPNLKSVFWPRVLCCPEFDRVVALHINLRHLIVCSLTTGEILHVERFERSYVVGDFHREGKWLFFEYKWGARILDLVNCVVYPIHSELKGLSFRGVSRLFAYFTHMPSSNPRWQAFDLASGRLLAERPDFLFDQWVARFGPSLLTVIKWLPPEGMEGLPTIGEAAKWQLGTFQFRYHRLDESGIPTNEIVPALPSMSCPVLREYQDKILVERKLGTVNHRIECLDASYEPVYSKELPLHDENGNKLGLGLMVETMEPPSICVAYRERIVPNPDVRRDNIHFSKLTAFRVDDGFTLWETDIQHEGPSRAFLADGRVLVSDPEGFDVIDVRTGERGRVDLPHVRCAAGNGSYLDFHNHVFGGVGAAPRNPYFFWQPEEKAPLVMGRIVE